VVLIGQILSGPLEHPTIRFFTNTPSSSAPGSRPPLLRGERDDGDREPRIEPGLGDPETVMAVPTQQRLDSYRFFSDHT